MLVVHATAVPPSYTATTGTHQLTSSIVPFTVDTLVWCYGSQWLYTNNNDDVVEILYQEGMCTLHIASAEAASQASPMHDPRGGTSAECCVTPSGWPDGVC